MKSHLIHSLALAVLLPLAACSQSSQDHASTETSGPVAQAMKQAGDKISPSAISREVREEIRKAQLELATSNIDVGGVNFGKGEHKATRTGPKAEITPQGELLIAGQKVAATPAQQTLLLDYRQQLIGIAESGMEIGAQGAELGMNAAKSALMGKFTGKSDEEIEASIKPQTEKIEAAAAQLCLRLPAMLSSQQKLAAEMPAFKPYATMDQSDVDDCGKEWKDKDGKKGFAVFSD